MAHTLLLFDPDFLLVVDDDTYVNVPQLTHGTNLSRYMTHEMRQAPLALGHLTGSNKVSNYLPRHPLVHPNVPPPASPLSNPLSCTLPRHAV